MALINTLGSVAQERFRARQLGKYHTLATVTAVNAGIDPGATFNDKTVSDKDEASFSASIDRLLAVAPADGYAIGTMGAAFVVASTFFTGNGKKMKILRRTSTTKTFSQTVKDDTSAGNNVAINGSFCDLSSLNQTAAYLGSIIDPTEVTPVGYVYSGGSSVAGGKSSPDGYKVQYASSAFAFGKGNANAGEGLGGLTPVVIKQGPPLNKVWKYGEKNVYLGLPSGATAPETGPPGDAYDDYITVRSSKQYADQNEKSLGKALLGYHPTKDQVFVLVQLNDPDNGGYTLDFYRDKFVEWGYENVVGMDGSDSVLLYDYKTKKLHVAPGSTKDNYLEIAVLLQV